MPRDPQKALERKRRYNERQRIAKYGSNVGDQRGRHKNHINGPNHPKWNDDRLLSDHGYVKVRVGKDHPLADPNGYAYEHLVVWAAAGLRLPEPGEILHHKNETKTDNRLDNLELKTNVAHGIGHQTTALTDHEIVRLREEFAAGDHTGTLARRYGIPIQTAWKIVRGFARRTAGGPIQEEPLRKKAAGRRLDGRTWDQMPEVSHG